MSLADLGDKLAAATQNPLFQFGIGMLSTPAQRDGRPSWAQVLGNGGMNVQRQAYMQQLAQQQQTQQQQQAQQQAAIDQYVSSLPQDQQMLARADPMGYLKSQMPAPGSARPFMIGGKLVSPTGSVIYNGQPQASPVSYKPLSEDLNGIPTFLGSDGKIYQPHNGSLAPVQAAQGGAQGVPGGLPAETQAYVPGVMGRLGGGQALNADGTASQALIHAVMQQESGGNPNAVSSAGAIGPMQLMPATAASVGVQNIRNPQQNIAGGTAYLNQLLTKYHGNVQQALAAYDAGPGRVDKALSGSGWAKPGKGNFQGGNDTVLPGDPSLSGQQYVQSITDPGTRDLAMSYLSGDNPPPSGTALKNNAIRSAWTAALHADPTLSTGTYTTRLNNRKAFIDGKQGQVINRINTAIGHLGNYIDQVKSLDEGGLKPLNAVTNYLGGATGNTTLGQINTIIPNLASEVAYVYNGGVPAEGEVKEREDAFNPNRGAKVNIANAVTTIHLLNSKLQALQSQYEQGAGKFGTPLTAINPSARQAIANLQRVAAELGVKFDGADAPGAGAPQSGVNRQPAQAHAGSDYSHLWGGH